MWITQLLTGPVFEDENKTRVARLLNWILLTLFALNLVDVILLAVFAPETLPTFWLNGFLFAFLAVSFWMMRRGLVSSASLVLLVMLWLLLIYYLPLSGGITSPAFGFLSIIIIGGAVLLGARGAAGECPLRQLRRRVEAPRPTARRGDAARLEVGAGRAGSSGSVEARGARQRAARNRRQSMKTRGCTAGLAAWDSRAPR